MAKTYNFILNFFPAYFTRKTPLALMAIIILGSFLRFYRISELTTFRTDQAVELGTTRDILMGKLTLIGIKTSNSEVRNGAVMYYLMAPILKAFNYDPIAGGVTQSILSLSSAFLAFFIVKKFNLSAALLAAFLVSASPLLVRYSRQTLLAYYPLFFNSLYLFLLLKLARKFTRFLAFISGILLGFTMQIHYATMVLLLAAFIFPLYFVKKVSRRRYYLGVVIGFIVGFSPLIIFDLRHELFNIKMLFNLFTIHKQISQPVGYANFPIFWSETLARLFGGNRATLVLPFVVFLLLTTGLFYKRLTQLEKICWLLFGCTITFTLLVYRDLRPPYAYISHYALPAFIPILILLSFSLVRIVKGPAWLALATVFFIFLSWWNQYGFDDDHGYTMSPGWDLPGIQSASEIIVSDPKPGPYNVAMLVDAENQANPLRYFLNYSSRRPLPVSNYSQAESLYLVVEPGLNINSVGLWEVESFGSYKISKTWSIQNGYVLNRLDKKRAS